MLPRKRFPVSLLLLVSLLLPLASCANSSTGQSLQKSLEADPRLQEQDPATATTTPTTNAAVEQEPQTSVQQPVGQTGVKQTLPSPRPTAPTSPLAKVPPFSTSTTLGASGTSNQPQAATGTTAPTPFTDLDKTPPELRQYLQDLANLSVLTPAPTGTKQNSARGSALFEPGRIITRREFSRWLFAANNRLYASRPALQVRAGLTTDQAAFRDVPVTDPDFAAIQGLAEAGILPSSLSGDSTVVTFQPDKPLTRESLLLWKVPMDIRQALPTATVDAVQQTWGFQDAAKISPRAMRSVLADFQNGDLSNIRRAFGYTTLFLPKKPVSRAEAAAALWHFGVEGEGRSAQEVLKEEGQVSNGFPNR